MTKQQTILITGATSGIGRHAALHLHAKGHRVIGAGRNEKALAELREAGLFAVRLDVNDADSIADAHAEVDSITDGYGLDALVNNAGYALFGPVEMLSDADVRQQFDTNVFGLLAVTRAFLPAMRERGFGRVVNISSVGGRITFPLGGAYHATKYAVEALSDALRMEVAQFGVGVSLIEPGYIETNFTNTMMDTIAPYQETESPYATALERANKVSAFDRFAASPKSVSRAIEKAIVSRRPSARYVAPWINTFGPWMRALLPTRLLDWVFRTAVGLKRPAALPPGAAARALPAS